MCAYWERSICVLIGKEVYVCLLGKKYMCAYWERSICHVYNLPFLKSEVHST